MTEKGYYSRVLKLKINSINSALGTSLIEKNFTLSHADKDHGSEFSLEAHELKQLCGDTKMAW